MMMDEDQKKQFDEWTKLMIYEAYLSEYQARKAETERANQHAKELKEYKWKIKQLVKNLSLEN
jgi:hypothetical protein